MPIFEAFVSDLDRRWKSAAKDKLPLRIIGSVALMLQSGYERGTKDSDVLEAADLNANTRTSLLAVPHAKLIDRFRAAVDFNSWDANVDLPRCVANLHRIERDMLDAAETAIELPDWI